MGYELDKQLLFPDWLIPGKRPLLPQELLAVDKSHPIGAKMRAFYLAGQCNVMRDLCGNLPDLEKAGTRPVPDYTVTNNGPVNKFTQTTGQILATPVTPTSRIYKRGSFGYPHVIGARYKQTSAATNTVLSLDFSTSTNGAAGIQIVNTGSGVYRYYVTSPDTDIGLVFYDGGAAMANSAHTVVCVSYSQTDHRLFIDGAQVGTSTTSVNPAFTKPVDLVVMGGNRNYTGISDFGDFADAEIEFAFISEDVWSLNDIKEFSRHPYDVLKLRTENVWTPAAAGGGTALAGGALSVATATGAITTGIPLGGASVALASANGNLTAQINLNALALAVAEATGALTAQIVLNGAALSQALASGTLSGGASGLSGSAQSIASASGSIITQIPLAGAAQAFVTGAGNLTTLIQLSGVVASINSATGQLTAHITLDGAALALALAAGNLTAKIQLDGGALSSAAASGILSNYGAYVPEPTRMRHIKGHSRIRRLLGQSRIRTVPHLNRIRRVVA